MVALPDIVVFLGPSLPLADARRVLPARYLPPARCGDVLRVRRWKPRAIALIDGLFERVAAVWHKEILLALEDGIAVYGASSMGALRAAELERFGMVGVGAIFEAYRDGRYTDDDEVTLVHGRGGDGHVPLSDAMVNIRATLDRAVRAGVLGEASARRVIDCAKGSFYKERSLDDAIAAVWPRPDEAEPARLRRFLAEGGFVDQKRIDALALLAQLKTLPAAARPPGELVNKSTFVLWLHHHVMTSAFTEPAADLPAEEHVAAMAPTLGARHVQVRRLAQLLAVAYGMARAGGASVGASRTRRATDVHPLELGPAARTARWAAARDLDGAAHAAFLERMGLVRSLVETFERRVGRRAARKAYADRMADLVRIDGRALPAHHGTPRGAKRRTVRGSVDAFALDLRAARLWSAVEAAAAELDFTPSADLKAASDEFRRSRGLAKGTDMLAWLRRSRLDAAGYEAFLERRNMLEALCAGRYLGVLGLRVLAEPVSWLLDALRLVDLYLPLKRRSSSAASPGQRPPRRPARSLSDSDDQPVTPELPAAAPKGAGTVRRTMTRPRLG